MPYQYFLSHKKDESFEPVYFNPKISIIKAWLQRFGDRDNESFSTQVKTKDKTWDISMTYEFDLDGNRIESNIYCRRSFKHLGNNLIEDRTDEELDEIIKCLKIKKEVW